MISFAAGSDFTAPHKFQDRSGANIDLTSATNIQMVVYPTPREGASASLNMTTVNSKVSVTSAVAGEVEFIFAADDLAAGEYTGEATATLSSGDVVFLGRVGIQVWEAVSL